MVLETHVLTEDKRGKRVVSEMVAVLESLVACIDGANEMTYCAIVRRVHAKLPVWK
jgi:hypothetical protein